MPSYKIVTSLPIQPSTELSPQLWSELSVIYRAIQSLLDGVSRFSGIDPTEQAYWKDVTPADTVLTGNLTRMYPIASVAIAAGQIINLFSDAGVIKARLANASGADTMAHGIANNAAAVGAQFEMQWLSGYVTSISGMTVGIQYWLSTTAGAVQNLPPTAAGTIQQQIGFSLAADKMIMDIPLAYKVN